MAHDWQFDLSLCVIDSIPTCPKLGVVYTCKFCSPGLTYNTLITLVYVGLQSNCVTALLRYGNKVLSGPSRCFYDDDAVAKTGLPIYVKSSQEYNVDLFGVGTPHWEDNIP